MSSSSSRDGGNTLPQAKGLSYDWSKPLYDLTALISDWRVQMQMSLANLAALKAAVYGVGTWKSICFPDFKKEKEQLHSVGLSLHLLALPYFLPRIET